MKLAGYIRVSTEGQVEAFGKDVQQEAIERWASLNGHEIVAWFEEDAVSGKIDGGARPQLKMLIACADSAYEGMVAFDATRIARRLVVQETLLALVWASGLRVFTATAEELCQDEEDPTKVLIRQILGVIAEFDHRITVNRLHNGRRAKISRGGYAGGGTKFGETVEGVGKASRLVEHLQESQVAREIGMRHSNGESMRAIASSLNRREVPTKMGGKWSAVQISRILSRL